MKRILVSLSLALTSAALAACGGGGGSTTMPPGGGSQGTPKLAAGFSQTGSSKSSSARQRVFVTPMASTGPTLNGSIVPIANFWVPDAYVAAGTYPSIGAEEVAYVTGGSLSAPVTFSTTSGPALPVVATPSPLPQPAGLPSGAIVIGGQLVGAAATPGQTIVTVAALDQTAQIVANTYPGLDLDTGGIYNTGAAGLTFTSTGAQPTANGATPDLSIDTSQSVSALVAPAGIVEVQKPIDQIQSTDFVQSKGVTTLRDVNVCNTDGITRSFILNTAAGLLVKFQFVSISGSDVSQGVCSYNDIRGPYAVASMSGFAF